MIDRSVALPLWHRPLTPLRKALIAAYCVAFPVFIVWLGWFALAETESVTRYLILSTELVFALSIVSLGLNTFKSRFRTVRQPAAGKSVDVFITTLDEDPSVLRTTIRSCLRMDYPHETYVLDDGNRPEIRKLAEELGARYISRDKGEHAKAGNLNHALARTQGEFIAVFDADGIPAKNFLARTLGYFHDRKVAGVQTHQVYYNLDGFMHSPRVLESSLWNEQSIFYEAVLSGRDASNASPWCGNGAVLRRSALLEVGGVASGSIVEDYHTSVRLNAAGYHLVFHPEPICYALGPRDYSGFLKQRSRWQRGAFQVLLQEWRSVFFRSPITFFQRVNILSGFIYYFEAPFRLAAYFVPPLLVLGGGQAMPGAPSLAFLFCGMLLFRTAVFGVLAHGRGADPFIGVFYFLKMCLYTMNLFVLTFQRKFLFQVTPKNARVPSSRDGSLWALFFGSLSIASFVGAIRLIIQGNHQAGTVLAAILSAYMTRITVDAFRMSRRRPIVADAYCFFSSVPAVIQRERLHPEISITSLLSDTEIWTVGPASFKANEEATLALELAGKSIQVKATVARSQLQHRFKLSEFYLTAFRLKPLETSAFDALWDYQIEFGLPRMVEKFGGPPWGPAAPSQTDPLTSPQSFPAPSTAFRRL